MANFFAKRLLPFRKSGFSVNQHSDKIFIFITVDLENMNTPLEKGKYSRNLFSIETVDPLLNILDRFNLKAVFFASVFEYCRFGENVISNVLRHLHLAGHDIQLHTHPAWCYGKEHMWQYSLEEQIKIIKHGKALLVKWLDKEPVAHRAGAYGVNQDTIEALRQNKIFIDSSMFFDHENCKVNWSANTVVCNDNITEIPVTGFYRNYYLDLILFKWKYRQQFVKTDIDWCSLNELLAFVDFAATNNIKIINLFMHSYSFLKHDGHYKHFKINDENTEKLENFLQICMNKPHLEFVTVEEFYKKYYQNDHFCLGNDYIPTIARHINILRP